MRTVIDLKAKGREVVTAINGLDALHKLEHDPVDLVLTESRMPVLDGLGLTARIVDQPKWDSVKILLALDERDAEIAATRIAPQRAYLTHISHRMGLHAEVEPTLPPNIHLAYDGLEIED